LKSGTAQPSLWIAWLAGLINMKTDEQIVKKPGCIEDLIRRYEDEYGPLEPKQDDENQSS
jgi:hypothetical protein